MQQTPIRYAVRIIITAICVANLTGLFYSCRKDPALVPPVISLIHGSGYISQDTILQPGQKVKIGIRASSSNANLTYFSIRFNDGTSQILLDTGMNSPTLEYTLDVIKTNSPKENWTFLIMDRNRVTQSVQIVFTKSDSSQWGQIRTLGDILLGAQENTVTGSFFSLADSSVMTLHQAYQNQPLADMVYYFGQYEGTLASPNEAEAPGFFTGPEGLINWSVKNETRYDTTLIAPGDFDLANNDSLILAAYEPTAGKKKGKYVEPGLIFSFKSPAGKLGLIKIVEVAPAPAGSVKMTIKIQK